MVSPKKLIDNELMKEIISIRVDTLWKMLEQKKNDYLPGVYEEGATGKFDNKGAIFMPGGLVYQDVDEIPIRHDSRTAMTPEGFRKKVRQAMQYDNATLLYPDGIASGINLDGGFFSKAAKRISTFKRAAFRRIPKIGSHKHLKINPDDIIYSHCPSYMHKPYGARTRISTCASVGLMDPPLFFAYCETQFNLSSEEADQFARRLDNAQDPVNAGGDSTLYPPYIVVCHDTRYKENSLTGLTRLLGIGKFGEFATLSFEQINQSLINEIKRKKQSYADEDIFAEYADMRVLCILRIYSRTNPGKRLQRYSMHVVSPKKYIDLNLEQLRQGAQRRYHLSV